MSAKELLEKAPEIKYPEVAWGRREPLPRERPAVPTMPADMVPEALRVWLVDSANRACLPLEMLAVPAIVAASGLIGRSASVKPREYSDWVVVPNLWGAIVAMPGFIKSDAMAEALRPVHRLEASARAGHKRLALEAKVEQMELEAQLRAAKGRAGKGQSVRGAMLSIQTRLEALEATPEKRYTTQDTTVEKLGELLRDNPRGIILVRDELASWVSSLEQEDSATARGFFLSAWNGTGGYTFDRIGRGTVHIPAACVSVLGTIQPGPLTAIFDRLRRDNTRADGLLQRFQVLVWPDRLPEWQAPTSWPDSGARDRAATVFERLNALEFRSPDDEENLEPQLLRFDNEAGQAFAEWHDNLEARLRGDELDEWPHFKSHLSKYRSLAPSLAVVFHLIESAGREDWSGWADLTPVSLEAVNLALDWCEFLELHARKVYASETNTDAQAAHLLANRIEAGNLLHGMRVRDLKRAGWRGLAEDGRADVALSALEGLGWLKVVELDTGGRASEVVLLHPELREGKI